MNENFCHLLTLCSKICQIPNGKTITIGRVKLKNDYKNQEDFVISLLHHLSMTYRKNLISHRANRNDVEPFDIDVTVLFSDVKRKVSLMRLVYNLHICLIMNDGERSISYTQDRRATHRYDPCFGLSEDEFKLVNDGKLKSVDVVAFSTPFGELFHETVDCTMRKFVDRCYDYLKITRVKPIFFQFAFHLDRSKPIVGFLSSEELEISIQILDNLQDGIYNRYFPPQIFCNERMINRLSLLLNPITEMRVVRESKKETIIKQSTFNELMESILQSHYAIVLEDDDSISRFALCNYLKHCETSVSVYLDGVDYAESQHYLDAMIISNGQRLSAAVCNLVIPSDDQPIELFRHYNYKDIILSAKMKKISVIGLNTKLTMQMKNLMMQEDSFQPENIVRKIEIRSPTAPIENDEIDASASRSLADLDKSASFNFVKALGKISGLNKLGEKVKDLVPSDVTKVVEKTVESGKVDIKDLAGLVGGDVAKTVVGSVTDKIDSTIVKSFVKKFTDKSIDHSESKVIEKEKSITPENVTSNMFNYVTSSLIRFTRQNTKPIILLRNGAKQFAQYLGVPVIQFSSITTIGSKKKEFLDSLFEPTMFRITATSHDKDGNPDSFLVTSSDPVKFYLTESLHE